MLRRSIVWVIALAFLCSASAAFAQSGANASLTGTVVDSGGGVIPGATVLVKSDSAKFEAVTNGSGEFSLPALPAGKYTVTVTLQGFKTAVVSDVTLNAATPATLKVTMQVGGVNEQVEVKGGAEIIQTQTVAIQKTISVDQINLLPLPTRNALNFVTLLPGVDTITNNRASTVVGLPQSSIGISIDGISVQNNTGKSTDGFYAYVTPRQDAVEQVTVTTATPGADSAGQGAVQIKFVTRSGTNNFTGSIYHYFRDNALNSNYYFNQVNGLPKNYITLNQYGGREGGPVVIPGLFDGHDKLFFFGNLEIFRQPSNATRTRTILTPQAQNGVFAYSVAGQTRTVDLAALAQASGQLTSFDPTVTKLLAQISAATQTTGVVNTTTDPGTLQYIYQSNAHRTETQPTVSMAANLSKNNRLTGAYTFLRLVTYPDVLNNTDPRFPGFPNISGTFADRVSGNVSLRSTLSKSMVNEVRFGGSWGPQQFSPQVNAGMFDNQGGYNLNLGLVTSATESSNPNWSGTRNNELDDTLNWLKGKHSIQSGFNFTRLTFTGFDQTVVPQISFGVDTNDPANAMFTTANFPGAANGDLNNAKALYALLTGRVTSISANARLDPSTGQYVYLGPQLQGDRLDEYGLFAQDSWRLKPSFTVNYGLRWEVQRPMVSLNNILSINTIADICGVSGTGSGPGGRPCNLFQPGTLTGTAPTFKPYSSSDPGYKTDWNNFAPNVGIAWLPHIKSGPLRTILGDPDQATIRAGFAIAYNRNGMSDYTGVYGSNPGVSISANRNVNNGNLVGAGQSLPLLLRDSANLGAPPFCASGVVSAACIPLTAAYPIISTTSTSVNAFDPNLQVAYTKSYSLGVQRALSKDMAVEVRYIGTRLVDGLVTENYNETNIVTNGFLNEFKLAEANLQANIAAGKGNTFAYTGAPGTSPLPIYLAYLTGNGAAKAGDPASYTGTSWTNTTFTGRFAVYNPNPGASAATDLNGSATFRANAVAAGLPVNFFQLNPNASSANVTSNGSFTRYNALQIELRRRLSKGLLVDANYSLARGYQSSLDTLQKARVEVQNTGVVPWAFKTDFTYDVPVGRGRRFGSNSSSVVNGIVGGWQVIGTARIQSGRTLDFGNVRLVGMTIDDLRNAYHIDIRNDATGKSVVYMLPQDIIDNTIKAFSVSATSATGYGALGAPTGRYLAPANGPDCIQAFTGDCAPHNTYVTGPVFSRFDFSFRKQFGLGGKRTADIEFDLLNAFNAINFTPVAQTGSGATIDQVTSAYQDLSNTFDPGGRLGQIVWRISW